MMAVALHAQPAEPVLPRPGSVVATSVIGEAAVIIGDQRKPLAADDRVRIGANVATGRRSLLTLVFSNGVQLDLRPQSELEIEEFGQATVTSSVKPIELKEEPTVSRTRLRLVRGEVGVVVKPLNASRGSSFVITLPAGVLRVREGTFQAGVEFSDLGYGVCTLELKRGAAEFELAGAASAPVPVGKKLAFALEIEKGTGVVKVGEMPKSEPAKPDAPKTISPAGESASGDTAAARPPAPSKSEATKVQAPAAPSASSDPKKR